MRARNIKPGFFDNEQIGETSMTARLLFIGLWCMADRDGIVEYRPQKLKIKIFPYDSLNVIKFLEELSQHGLIVIWTDNDKIGQFIEIPTFTKHQKPHPNEKSSNLKDILESSDNLIKLHEIKCNYRLILGMRKEERGKRNTEGRGPFNNVFLSDVEFKKLTEKFNGKTEEKISALSEYMSSKGKKYKSHYATILMWSRKDKPEETQRGKKIQ